MNTEQVALLKRCDALMANTIVIHNDVIRSIQAFIADGLYNVAEQAIADLEQSTYSTITCAASHHWAQSHDWFINHVQSPSPCGTWKGGRWIVYVRDSNSDSTLVFASIKALKIWAGY